MVRLALWRQRPRDSASAGALHLSVPLQLLRGFRDRPKRGRARPDGAEPEDSRVRLPMPQRQQRRAAAHAPSLLPDAGPAGHRRRAACVGLQAGKARSAGEGGLRNRGQRWGCVFGLVGGPCRAAVVQAPKPVLLYFMKGGASSNYSR